MRSILNGKELTLGTCYYPEHWPQKLWREDLGRMLSAGIEVIRVAEFAWNLTEPEEGVFVYDFWDRFLDLCDEMGMKVIFGTPTATPPAWLTQKYPQVLNCDQNGVVYHHGGRRHYNYNSQVYRTLSARIVEKLAAHYAGRKCIIGWQLDNEFNCEQNMYYSEADTQAFRLWLQERYHSLDALNEAWGTVFWNQTYTGWEQVYVPRPNAARSINPHLMLDYERFVSDSTCSYARMQSDILRPYLKPDDFITTNGMFGHIDNHRMNAESLDFYTYDSYPNFAYCLDSYKPEDTGLRDRNWSRNLTQTRSVSPAFGIMEQQSGANGWNTRMEAPSPRPGQLTLWTMQSIAHGADYVSYFRWRTATIGTEIYWHGILDYSGRDNRRLAEVKAVHGMLQKLQAVAGSRYAAKVAILKDYDNVFDAELDRWHERVAWQSEMALFSAAQRTHTPLDYVYLDHTDLTALSRYSVIFDPHPVIMTEERAALLRRYAEQGGTVVFGCRSAYKDVNGHCVMDLLPGLLSDLTGADVPEYSFIAPDAGPVTIEWDGEELQAAVFTDIVTPAHGGTLEGTYTADYDAGSGALVSKQIGLGKAFYYGTAFTEQAARVFLKKLGAASPWSDVIQLPETCELAVRSGEQGEFMFILNYMKEPAVISLKRPVTDTQTGQILQGERTIPAYGVMILRL